MMVGGRAAFRLIPMLCVIVLTIRPMMAQERVPTPAEDLQMLHTFRGQTVLDLGLTEQWTTTRHLYRDSTGRARVDYEAPVSSTVGKTRRVAVILSMPERRTSMV